MLDLNQEKIFIRILILKIKSVKSFKGAKLATMDVIKATLILLMETVKKKDIPVKNL